MESELEKLGFAGALAQSRSVQGVIRVLDLFANKHPGLCLFEFKRAEAQGVEVNFGTSSASGGGGGGGAGLADLLRMVELTDQLMLLEAMISSLRDRRVDPVLIEALVLEAEGVARALYPLAPPVTGSHG